MSKFDKKQIPMWAKTGHHKPVSRRDFLSFGLIPFSAAMFAPAWTKLLLPETAFAQTQCPSGGSGMVPLITLNLAGGAGLMANILPLGPNGQKLDSYNIMGLGDPNTLPEVTEFGNVRFPGLANPADPNSLISKFLLGMRNRGGGALAKTSFVWVASRSGDDTSENRADITGMAIKSGLVGSILPGLGTDDSATGGRHLPAVVAPPSPLVVDNFGTISGALGYAAAAGSRLNPSQKSSLARLINNLSNSQARKLASVSSGAEIRKVIDCAGVKNVELSSLAASPVDPRADATAGANLQTIWGISAATAANNRELVFATLAYNAMKGNSGPVNLLIGGYDYHDGTRTNGDTRDQAAGEVVGRLLATAEALNSKLFIYVTTDGSVVSANSTAFNSPWTSDRGIANASYILYYDPAGRRPTSDYKIGHYTVDGQAADEDFVTGGSIERAATAVFANYLEVNGRIDRFSSVAGSILDTAALNQILRF